MNTSSFHRALSLSIRLLTASCGAAVAVSGVLAAPGCSRCEDSSVVLKLVREASPTTATLRGVALYDGETQAVAVGDGGTVLVRGAEGWTTRSSGTTADLHAVSQVGGMAIAVGAGGVALRSADPAGVWETWETINTGTTADLHGAVLIYDVAVAVGDGVLLRSEDSGASWVPVGLPTGVGVLRAVINNEDRVLLAVGDGGTAVYSEDGGLSWTMMAIGTEVDLRAVAVDSSLGDFVVAGVDGSVFARVNGAWEMADAVELAGLAGLSPGADWLVGADGGVRGLQGPGDLSGLGEFVYAARDADAGALLAVDGDSYAAIVVGEGGVILHATRDVEVTGSHVCRSVAVEGRPFTIGSEARTAMAIEGAEWVGVDPGAAIEVAALPAGTRERLAAAWTRDALYEHASVASFARFVLQLLAVGAPPELVLAGQVALGDEVRHAQQCFALASAYAGAPVGPGPLAIDGALPGHVTLAELAAATVLEGCVNETIAALMATTAATLAEDPIVRATLSAIAADERRHAALAWRTVAWALGRGDATVREAVLRAFAVVPALEGIDEDGLQAHGRLSARAQERVARAAWQQVIAPQAAALLASSRGVIVAVAA